MTAGSLHVLVLLAVIAVGVIIGVYVGEKLQLIN